MKNMIVDVPSIKLPIQPSPGFEKKLLSDYKLDILGLCGFGCRYCSSNEGNYLRIQRNAFAERTVAQLGKRYLPSDTPSLMFRWPDVLQRLEQQIEAKDTTWGSGKVLVFSMLTDGFSPELVRSGLTERALRLVVEWTSFRIRVLTKNAIVGSPRWIKFFGEYPNRFVVGLSTGTLDDDWARRIEIGASLPTARLRALRDLQDAGVPTFGMLCPVFPDLLGGNALDKLVTRIRPDVVEHLWAEPYNDRNNWAIVRDGYERGSFGYEWFTTVYERGQTRQWSAYATRLYEHLHERAIREGWIDKLRYLLYEHEIAEADAPRFRGLQGLLLQSAPDPDGFSRNAGLAREQARVGMRTSA
jgi:DNA repair photolyase